VIHTYLEGLIVIGRYHPAWRHLKGFLRGLPAEGKQSGYNIAAQKSNPA
jgi:hypothetical protein